MPKQDSSYTAKSPVSKFDLRHSCILPNILLRYWYLLCGSTQLLEAKMQNVRLADLVPTLLDSPR